MRHIKVTPPEYAIHEVYFDAKGEVVTYTMNAVSPRAVSIDDLRQKLLEILQYTDEKFPLGDLQYLHHKDDVWFWLEYIDQSPIDYQ